MRRRPRGTRSRTMREADSLRQSGIQARAYPPRFPVTTPDAIANPLNHANRCHTGALYTDSWHDTRRVRLLTRGNVDGITSAALVLSRFPDARVSFVTNATVATQHLRRDLSSDRFFVIDLGLTPELAKTMGRKASAGADVTLLDHHQQTLAHADLLPPNVQRLVIPGISAAGVTRTWLDIPGLAHVVAMADLVEYCHSDALTTIRDQVGADRLEEESKMLDFAWRHQISDDRFRVSTARRLAAGLWPSEIGEVQRRYLQMVNEGRWERALERVRQRVQFQDNIAILRFGRRKPSLLGFGSRALTAVAAEHGCTMALLVHKRRDVTSISARIMAPGAQTHRARQRSELNLGRFLDEFTQQYGIAGGGHPESAGGKIPSRHLGTFMRELACFA